MNKADVYLHFKHKQMKTKVVSEKTLSKMISAFKNHNLKFEIDIHWHLTEWLSEIPYPFVRLFKGNNVSAIYRTK